MSEITRRHLLLGAAGLTGTLAVGGLPGCSSPGTVVTPAADAVEGAEAARRVSGRSVVSVRLTPRPVTVDLGGPVVQTWAYGDTVPGPLLRATAGDLLRVTVDNQLPTGTSVHWHGIALRNDMDGVPGITQRPIDAGTGFEYEFTAPDPGTYFYHPHSGVQLDRGLYGVLVVDDPAEPRGLRRGMDRRPRRLARRHRPHPGCRTFPAARRPGKVGSEHVQPGFRRHGPYGWRNGWRNGWRHGWDGR